MRYCVATEHRSCECHLRAAIPSTRILSSSEAAREATLKHSRVRFAPMSEQAGLVIIGVPKESYPGERRVALVPAVLPTLTKAGFEVHIQAGAGIEAGYPDSQYADKGAKIVADRAGSVCCRRHYRAGSLLRIERRNRQAGRAAVSPRSDSGRISASVRLGRSGAGDRARRRDLVFRGIDAAHHARPEHGRALLDGQQSADTRPC